MARGIWTAGSGGADLDELGSAGATPAHVLSGRTFYGAGSEKVQTGVIPVVQGATIVPGTVNKTAIASGRYTNASIFVSGDPNLVPANIKKNSVIFGVRGTFEGWVPTANDLYYNGVWTMSHTLTGGKEDNTQITGNATTMAITFNGSKNVQSFSKLILYGAFATGQSTDIRCRLHSNGSQVASESLSYRNSYSEFSFDISQISTLSNFKIDIITGIASDKKIITRIQFS